MKFTRFFGALSCLLGAGVLFCFGMMATASAQNGNGPVSLASFRDRNRVFVVYLPAADAAKAKRFRELWTGAGTSAGIRDRDGVLVEFAELGAQPDVAQRLELREGQFTFALFGKDGHVAYRTNEPVEPGAVFAQIDAMPMRREEMKARGQKPAQP